MNQQKSPINQIRGMRNNAQGHIFEEAVEKACQIYRRDGRAIIDKTPEPFRVLKKSADGVFTGRFTALAQPDFQGVLSGGQSIIFETKYTTADRMERRALTDKQMETLESHYRMGAVAMVVLGIGQRFYAITWHQWQEMKQLFGRQYITPDDIEQWRVRFNGAVLFLDYVHSEKQANFQTFVNKKG